MQAPGGRQRMLVKGALFALTACMVGMAHSQEAAATSCTEHVLQAERELGIPRGLLLSMALVESGQGGVPHPFALNVNGKTIHAEDIEKAKSHLHDSRGRLRTDVTAGCMQISVQHHRTSFKPIEKILDPSANVWYAARYLARLRADSANWSVAVARYNGGSRAQQRDYTCKIYKHVSQFDRNTAGLFDGRNCTSSDNPSIAPETRRAFNRAQVAEAG